MSDEPGARVFVYGTLKQGFPNHHLLPPATYVGAGVTAWRLPLVPAGPWYTPTLIIEPGVGHHIVGELYDVDRAGLATLDELEGVGRSLGFDRVQLEVNLPDGWTIAETYAKPRSRIDVIHGDPIAEYTIDSRYVAGENRDAPNRGLGSEPSAAHGHHASQTE